MKQKKINFAKYTITSVIITSKKKFETQKEIFLAQGRKKLSEHLKQEEAMYHQELINN